MGNWKTQSQSVSFILITLLGVGFSGCHLSRLSPVKKPAADTVNAAWIRSYARVAPQEIDHDITPVQLDRMFIKLSDIKFDKIIIDQTRFTFDIPAASDKTSEKQPAVNACKLYLQGKWLIDKASRTLSGEGYDSAYRILQEGVSVDPNNTALLSRFAEACYQLKKQQDAVAACQRVITLDPNQLLAYHILADIRLAQGDTSQAISLMYRGLQCPRATVDNPLSALMYLQFATALRDQGYLAASVYAFENAWQRLSLQRQYAQAQPVLNRIVNQAHIPLLAMAEIYLKMGYIDLCVDTLRKTQREMQIRDNVVNAFVLSLARQNIPLHIRYRQVFTVCRYLLAEGDNPQAQLDIFYQACSIMSKYNTFLQTIQSWAKPDNGKALLSPRLLAYGLTLAEQYDKAEEILLAIVHKKNNAGVYLDLAALYARKQRWNSMLDSAARYLALQPKPTDGFLSKFHDLTQHISDTDKWIAQWDGDFPSLSNSWSKCFLVGDFAQQNKKYQTAEKFYRQALNLKPACQKLRSAYLAVLIDLKKYDDVLKFIGNEDKQPYIIRYAALASKKSGKLDYATACYQHLIELEPDNIEHYLALGQIRARQGNFPQAEAIYLQILKRWPGKEIVYFHLLQLYSQWAAHNQKNKIFLAAVEKRSQQMLQIWLQRDPARTTKNTRQSILALEQLRQKYPRTRIISLMLSKLYEQQHQSEKALATIHRLLEFFPDEPKVLARAADLEEKYGDLSLASKWRCSLCDISPEDPGCLAGCLRNLRLTGQLQKAMEYLRKAVARKPWLKNPQFIAEIQSETLLLFMVNRNFAKAVTLFSNWNNILNQALHKGKIKPASTVSTTKSLIWALAMAGSNRQAIQLTLDLYHRLPETSPGTALWLSRMLNVQLDFQASVALLDNLIETVPDDSSLRLQLYLTMIDQGHKKEAFQAAQKWQAQNKDDKIRVQCMVIMARYCGDDQLAIRQLRDYLKRYPTDAGMQLLLLQSLINAGNFSEAEDILSLHEKIDRNSLEWLDAWIKYDLSQGNCSQAVARIDRLIDTEEPAAQILTLKAQIMENCGKLSQATGLLEQAVSSDPCNVSIRIQLSLVLDRMGRHDKALEHLEFLLDKQPDNPNIQNNLAYTLLESHKNPKRVRQLLQKSLQSAPDSAPTLDSLGWFYYKEGDFKRALEFINQATANIDLPDPEILDHLGDIHFRLKNTEKARFFWQKALKQLKSRVKTEKQYSVDKSRIENKLRNLAQGKPVLVAPIFKESRLEQTSFLQKPGTDNSTN